jgi:hypothetical protein
MDPGNYFSERGATTQLLSHLPLVKKKAGKLLMLLLLCGKINIVHQLTIKDIQKASQLYLGAVQIVLWYNKVVY